jgi:hypothetical protein
MPKLYHRALGVGSMGLWEGKLLSCTFPCFTMVFFLGGFWELKDQFVLLL